MYLFRIFPSSYTLGLLDSYAGGRARSDSQKDFSHWKTVSPGQEIPFSYKERDKIRHQVGPEILFHSFLNSNLNVFRKIFKKSLQKFRWIDSLLRYHGKNAVDLADTHTFLRKNAPFIKEKAFFAYICTLQDSLGLRTVAVFLGEGSCINLFYTTFYLIPFSYYSFRSYITQL